MLLSSQYASVDAAVCVRLFEGMKGKIEGFDEFLKEKRGSWLKKNYR